MNEYDVKRLALVLSIQAEIEGMKAENVLREQNEQSPAYGEKQFNECASRLENLFKDESKGQYLETTLLAFCKWLHEQDFTCDATSSETWVSDYLETKL